MSRIPPISSTKVTRIRRIPQGNVEPHEHTLAEIQRSHLGELLQPVSEHDYPDYHPHDERGEAREPGHRRKTKCSHSLFSLSKGYLPNHRTLVGPSGWYKRFIKN